MPLERCGGSTPPQSQRLGLGLGPPTARRASENVSNRSDKTSKVDLERVWGIPARCGAAGRAGRACCTSSYSTNHFPSNGCNYPRARAQASLSVTNFNCVLSLSIINTATMLRCRQLWHFAN
ncbi:hypothetical protein J6590_008375 [Homalodisca vitripennis]|nr:hypothetical protein J6590_008375 [Homalodisca vitripennis]